MHFRTHVKEELRGISGQDEYADGMVEHDMHVGKFLDLLDELGVAESTIVFYSTDIGPHMNTWPDAGMTPFWSEKNTNWEGGWRVPAMVRWPGRIPEGEITNEIVHHMDWLPTFLAAAGNESVKEDLLDGVTVEEMAGREYRVHLDGYNILPLLTGEASATSTPKATRAPTGASGPSRRPRSAGARSTIRAARCWAAAPRSTA